MIRFWSVVAGISLAMGLSVPSALADVELTTYSVPAVASVTEDTQSPGMTAFTIVYPTKGGKKLRVARR
jgi:hypothetical protein